MSRELRDTLLMYTQKANSTLYYVSKKFLIEIKNGKAPTYRNITKHLAAEKEII